MADRREVTVVYAKADRQWQRAVALIPGLTIGQAIQQSGLLEELPEIDLSVVRVGIFGRLKALDTVLRDHDRIELYRPLTADPKESRRQRSIHRQRHTGTKQAGGQTGT